MYPQGLAYIRKELMMLMFYAGHCVLTACVEEICAVAWHRQENEASALQRSIKGKRYSP